MALRFRNVDAQPSDQVDSWPYEALVAALERGLVPDWQPIFSEIRRQPWGQTARRIEAYLSYRRPPGVAPLFEGALEHARRATDADERAEVARRVRDAVAASGLTMGRFAERVGTSASRLSTYAAAKVTPSAAMLVRIERAATQSPLMLSG